MAYVSKQLADEIILPDGCVATSVSDVQAYLNRNGLALAGDYSADYLARVREKNERDRKRDLFKTFLHYYKRMIWNE